jgi:hypothetical protein
MRFDLTYSDVQSGYVPPLAQHVDEGQKCALQAVDFLPRLTSCRKIRWIQTHRRV